MNRLQTRTGRGAAAALSLAVVAGLAACSPITTHRPYAASDGIRVDVASGVTVENLLVLTSAKGAPGSVQAGLVNATAADVTIAIDTLRFDVPAGSTVILGGESGETATITAVDAAPGAVLRVAVGTPDDATQVPVPVLDGSHADYAPYVPAAS